MPLLEPDPEDMSSSMDCMMCMSGPKKAQRGQPKGSKYIGEAFRVWQRFRPNIRVKMSESSLKTTNCLSNERECLLFRLQEGEDRRAAPKERSISWTQEWIFSPDRRRCKGGNGLGDDSNFKGNAQGSP